MSAKAQTGNDNFPKTKSQDMDRHPLMIHLVLENVFSQNLSFTDLLQCRRVCRLWNIISTPYLKQTGHLVDITFQQFEEERIKDFLNLFAKKRETFSFWTFHFKEVDLVCPLSRRLLRYFGKHLSVLKLDYNDSSDTWNKSVENMNLGTFLKECCPSLKRLVIKNLPTSVKKKPIFEFSNQATQLAITHLSIEQDDRKYSYSQQFLYSLVMACPDLFDVRVKTNSRKVKRLSGNVLQLLAETDRIKSIEKLQLSAIRSDSLPGNAFIGSCLKRLTVKDMKFEEIHPEHFQHILESVSSTLEHLSIEALYTETLFAYSQTFTLQFPHMEALRKLKLNFRCLGSMVPSISSFGKINYLKRLPNLERLDICGLANFYLMKEWFSLKENTCPQLRLKELRLPYPIKNAKLISDVGKVFPNIVKLTIPENIDDNIRIISKTWPRLQDLNLLVFSNFLKERYSGCIDSNLCGMPKKFCKLAHRKGYNYLAQYKNECNPPTANFQCLNRLTFKLCSFMDDLSDTLVCDTVYEKITDISCCLAFSKLNSITYLHVDPHLSLISDKCAQELCAQLELYCNRSFTTFVKCEHNLSPWKKCKKWHRV